MRNEREPHGGRGYGQGFPSAAGGTARRTEGARRTLDREIRQELPDYQLTGTPVRVGTNRVGNTTYEQFDATVAPRNPPAQPLPGEDPRDYQENVRSVRVNPGALGLDNSATNQQILAATARAAGVRPEPWHQTPQQQAQYQMYQAADNYPMQAYADRVRGDLPQAPPGTAERNAAWQASHRRPTTGEYNWHNRSSSDSSRTPTPPGAQSRNQGGSYGYGGSYGQSGGHGQRGGQRQARR